MKKEIIYHDLDSLAGTWDENEYKNFISTTKSFNFIDEDLWKLLT